MKIGTKSVLFGAHCFFLHPFFVALAWWKLYGFPYDPRLWVAFIVHDLGYLGKPNMDGPEGETHVEFGAKIMSVFDLKYEFHRTKFIYRTYNDRKWDDWELVREIGRYSIIKRTTTKWADFSMYHSRYYAKKNGAQPSKLCFADKLSFALTPRWIYLPMVNATGEIHEYLKNAKKAETKHWKPVEGQKIWHAQLCDYMTKWVEEHKDGSVDTWTDSNRHAVTEGGVWK